MPRLLQYGHYLADRPCGIELYRRNDALPNPVVEIFKKDKRSSLPFDRKWIGVEAMSGIFKYLPAWPG